MPRDTPVQLQLLAAATVINLKRLIAHHNGAELGQTGDPDAPCRHDHSLTGLLTRVVDEISRLVAADSSTGS